MIDIAERAIPVIAIQLNEHERTVLEGVGRFKASYPGSTRIELMNALLKERGQKKLSEDAWATAQKSLIRKGMLTPLGNLTAAGRAALGGRFR